jgi:rare lipoprotein A
LRPSFTLRRMRSVHVIIATIALAVPASAVALTGVASDSGQAAQNSVQTPLNLQVSRRHLKFGDAVIVSGTAPATEAGKRLLLQALASGQSSWRSLGTTTISPVGTFRTRVSPRRSGVLRAVAQSSATAAADRTTSARPSRSAPSPQPSVTVGARFTPADHDAAVLSSHPVHVTGRLLPATTGRRVSLQSHSPRGWHTLSSGRTGASGGYRLSVAPDAAGGQRLRLAFGGDDGNAATTRGVSAITVLHPSLASWYEDAGNTACGFHAGLGVANRNLPCGTKVTLHYGTQTVTAVVDDRGPYAGGRDWDLSQHTASALGFAGVGTVWSSR